MQPEALSKANNNNNNNHHLLPWIRSFDLFRHRRVTIFSWVVHDPFFPEVCSWGRVSAVWCCPFFRGGRSSFVCIWVSHLVFLRSLLILLIKPAENKKKISQNGDIYKWINFVVWSIRLLPLRRTLARGCKRPNIFIYRLAEVTEWTVTFVKDPCYWVKSLSSIRFQYVIVGRRKVPPVQIGGQQ